jgi:hypothetical protein
MSSPNLRAYMPEPDDDAMSASSTGSSLLDTPIDDQVLFSSVTPFPSFSAIPQTNTSSRCST